MSPQEPVPGILDMQDDLDILIGLWHQLSDQAVVEIERAHSKSTETVLKRVLMEALGATDVGDDEFTSAAKFAQYVVALRANERAWSRRLEGTILAAQDWVDQGKASEARRVFDEYQATCPWRMFVEIAATQRRNTLE